MDKEVVSLSQDVVESYIFATSKHNLSIYSERLLMMLVKAAQCQVYGLNFRDGSGIRSVDTGPLGTTVVIDVKDLLGEGDTSNYVYAKNAVRELITSAHEHEEVLMKNGKPVLDKDGRPIYKYEAHSLVNDVTVNKVPGQIEVEVNRHTWSAILDFAHGWRRYDLLTACKLKRVYALRIFKIVSNQKYPIRFTIDELKQMWGISDKYKKTNDFLKAIESAKEELDSVSSWTFEWKAVYSQTAEENRGRRGRNRVTSIEFIPVHQTVFDTTSDVAKRVDPRMMLGDEVFNRLVKNFSFSVKSIQSNLAFFNMCYKTFGKKGGVRDPRLEDFLMQIAPGANRANNPQGYVVNALKKHLREVHGIVYKDNKFVRVDELKSKKTKTAQGAVVHDDAPMAGLFASILDDMG